MKRNRLVLSVLLLTLFVASTAFAADYNKGLNAWLRGDFATAMREFRPLAEQGHARAQTDLGYMYDHGQGVTQDYKTAAKWYRLAAKQGNAAAREQLEKLQKKIATKSPAADWGKGMDAYKRGDYVTALREIRPLAEQGHAKAQSNLGVMYDEGYGVTQDYKMAVKWYTLAAEQEVASAQFNLGMMYEFGESVPQDYVYAHMWFNIAASSGDKMAAKSRDTIAKEMSRSQIKKAQNLAKKCVKKKYKGC